MAEGQPGSFAVYVAVPGKFVLKTSVSGQEYCDVLSRLFPQGASFRFIYQGQLMDGGRTFQFYGVTPNTPIIALRECEANNAVLDRWLEFSFENELFDSQIESVMNTTTRREVMRLRDVALLRRQMHPLRMRRIADRGDYTEGAMPRAFMPTNLRYDPPADPSDEPLPALEMDQP
jgi:hypothetical protein